MFIETKNGEACIAGLDYALFSFLGGLEVFIHGMDLIDCVKVKRCVII